MIKILIPVTFLALLSACAVMDISTLDSAVPLRPDKGYEFALYNGIGLDLSTAVYLEDDQVDYEPDEEPGLGADFISGYKMNIGINPELDFCGRFFISSYSWGLKAGVKKLIWQEDKRYFSVLPSFTHITGRSYTEYDNGEEEELDYISYGFENQFIYTYQSSRYFSYTLAARGNYNRLKMADQTAQDDLCNVFHGGIRGNLRLSLGPFYIVPEAGYEMVPIVNANLAWMPSFAFAAGMNF